MKRLTFIAVLLVGIVPAAAQELPPIYSDPAYSWLVKPGTKERRAYFKPLHNVTTAPAGDENEAIKPIVRDPLGTAIAYSSAPARAVVVLNADGTHRCSYSASPLWGPLNISIANGLVVFGLGQAIVFIDPATCKETAKHVLWQFANVAFVSPSPNAPETLLVGGDVPKNLPDSIRTMSPQIEERHVPPKGLIQLWHPTKGILWRSQPLTIGPRSGVLGTFSAIIADTFQHRILFLDIRTDTTDDIVPSYYPQGLAVGPSGDLYAVEEHLNRVVRISKNNVREIVFGCNLPLFRDPTLAFGKRMPGEEKNTVPRINNPLELSACAYEIAGPYTLYSPNDLYPLPDGSLLITDTDNHRIIRIDANGLIMGEVQGLDSPSGIVAVP